MQEMIKACAWMMAACIWAAALAACDDGSSGGADSTAGEGGGGDGGGQDAGGEGGEAGGSEGGSGGESGMVAPGCVDGDYAEVLPAIDADLSALEKAYEPGNQGVQAFVLGVLAARYPTGKAIVEGGMGADAGTNCILAYLGDTSSAGAIYTQLSTVVHECGHFFDFSIGGFGDAGYFITEELDFECKNGSIPQYGGQTFSRSLIKGDAYAALHEPCPAFNSPGDCDGYAALYLTGDPADATFDSGDQGFDTLLEETIQYVNSLATGYAFADKYPYAISERDGLLTFLWYVMRYLRMARLDYPDAYELLSGDACWRQAILTVWGRAWLYLGETEGHPRLGINDTFLATLVDSAELLEEIQRLRDAEGCTP